MLPSTPVVPHNRAAEEALIASVLVNPDIFPELQDMNSIDFYIHRHQWIWEAFVSLKKQGTPLDFRTIVDELERAGHLAELGGPAYLTGLINQCPTSVHASAYARTVKTEALKRRMLQGATAIATAAHDGLNTDELLAVVADETREIQHCSPANTIVTAGEAASRSYDVMDRIAKTGQPPSIPSGYYDLDRILTGFYDSCLYLVATRPGVGKSTLLTDIARHAAIKRGKNVAIFSMEMKNRSVINRIIAAEYDLSSSDMRTGRLPDGAWEKINAGLEASQSWPIVIDDTPRLPIETLAARAHILRARGQCDLLIVDYVQLLGTAQAWGSVYRSRQQELGYISRSLKILTGELDIPVIAAAQVNRLIESRADRKIVLSDIREAGDFEQDADGVILLQPPDPDELIEAPLIDIVVAKHREGPAANCQLRFLKKCPRFENLHDNGSREWWE